VTPRPRGAAAVLAFVGLSLWVGRGVGVGAVDLQAIQIVSLIAFVFVVASAMRSSAAPLTWRRPTTRLFTVAIVVAVTLIVIAAGLSAWNAIEIFSVVRFISRYVLGLVLFASILHLLRDPSGLRFLERTLLTGATLSVSLSAVGFFVPALGAWTIRYGDRAQALLNHPNQFAMLLTALVPIAFGRALRSPQRVGPWIVLLIVSAGVALTGSKVNLAILVVTLPVVGWLAAQLRRGPLRRLGRTVAFTLGSIAAAWVAFAAVRRFNPRTLATLERLLVEPESIAAVVTRSEMWRTAIDHGVEHPWFGVGADHAGYYIGFAHAHNVFAEFFLTMGVVGLAALGTLVLTLMALSTTSIFWALAKRGLPYADRLSLLVLPMSVLIYLASNQSSESFGGTTLPILWIAAAMTLAQLDHAMERRASQRCET
jgi:O-antigen ligase